MPGEPFHETTTCEWKRLATTKPPPQIKENQDNHDKTHSERATSGCVRRASEGQQNICQKKKKKKLILQTAHAYCCFSSGFKLSFSYLSHIRDALLHSLLQCDKYGDLSPPIYCSNCWRDADASITHHARRTKKNSTQESTQHRNRQKDTRLWILW